MNRTPVGLLALVCLALALLSLQCNDCTCPPTSELPAPTLQELLAAPDTLRVDGLSIVLSTFLMRDFMPLCPPDGRPLTGSLQASELAGHPLPSGSSVLEAWVIYSGELWNAPSLGPTTPGHPGEVRPDRLFTGFSDGPKWGPEVAVDVVVSLRIGSRRTFFLRAPNQWIGRSD